MTWLATVLDQEMLETIRKVNIAGRNTADAAVTSAPAACRVRVWNLMSPRTGTTGGHPPPEGAKVGYALARVALRAGALCAPACAARAPRARQSAPKRRSRPRPARTRALGCFPSYASDSIVGEAGIGKSRE